MNFISVTEEYDLESTVADGVLGLGRIDEGNTSNSLIYTLWEEKVINRPVFSFHLTETRHGSKLYFGDITENEDLKYIEREMTHCYISDTALYWECKLHTLEIKSNTVKESHANVGSPVIFDTGTSYLIIPINDFIMLLDNFNIDNENDCAVTPYFQLICKCNSVRKYNDMLIVLDFNGAKIEIKIDDLLEFYPNMNYSCRFQIIIDTGQINAWILGDSVLKNMFISFDMENSRIGFTPYSMISPSGRKNDKSNRLFYLLCFLALLLTIYLLFRWTNNNINTGTSDMNVVSNYQLMNNNAQARREIELKEI